MPRPKNKSNIKASSSYNNTNLKKRKLKYRDKLLGFTWYYIVQNTQTYIIAQLPSTRPRFSHTISLSVNRFAKTNHLRIRASSQTKNNLLYLCEDDFKAYFEAKEIAQPEIKEATQQLKDLFNDNQISSINATDRNYLSQLPRFTWYQLEQDQQAYVVTELPSNNPNLANHIARAINRYANEKTLLLHASYQKKNNLLYLTEESFKYYFSSIAQNSPAVNQPSTELIAKFSMSGKRKHFAKNVSTSKKGKSNYLEMLVDFTWYYLVQDTQTYIITQLPSTNPSLSHNIAVSINRYAKTDNLKIHASFQQKNNLLYLSEKDFKAYFDARNIMQPTIKEATQKLKGLFNDNKISSVSTTEKNYLSQLPRFTWYQLEQDEQTYIVTELPSSQPNLADHIARAINHYSKEKTLQLHASYQRENNLLYLTKSSFTSYFSSINQNPPAVNDPPVELIAKFASRCNLRKKHTAYTLNQMANPISSSDSQPEGLVISEPREQLLNLDTTQSSLLDQLSHFISENDNNSSMTIVQSSDSLTEDCTPSFDDFDFNELYYAWELDKQAQDGNNRVDEIENSSEYLRQIHPTCS